VRWGVFGVFCGVRVVLETVVVFDSTLFWCFILMFH